MPWAPRAPAPYQIWGGFCEHGGLCAFWTDRPSTAIARADGALTLRLIGATELRTHPWCGLHFHPFTLTDKEKRMIVKGSIPQDPAPEGTFRAVCVDEHDLGVVTGGKYGPKQKVLLAFELEELNPKNENKPFVVYTRFGASIGMKSLLGKFLSAWRGQKFTPEDLKNGFDLEKVVGVPCQVQIVHNHVEDGTTYANIAAIMPLARGQEKLKASGSYVRMKDRTDGAAAAATAGGADPDDDLPF